MRYLLRTLCWQMAIAGVIVGITMNAHQTHWVLMWLFVGKKILLPREATTKAWKAGDRVKECMAIPNRTGNMHVGGRREALRPWQRSWGRRLDIRKGGIEPQESPWKSSNIYPHNQSLPTLLLCALTYTSGFTGGCPPPPLSEKELT